MKKKAIAFLLGACMACALSACGGNGGDSTEAGTEKEASAAERTKLPETASVDMDIDYGKQVSKLCDYSKVPVTITGVYEMSDEQFEAIILADLTSCYANLQEVTDRDTIKEDDIVKVDYVGSVDGVEFDGGAADGQYVKVGDGNGYIDGFTAGLPGAKVGDEVSCDVTFPDEYPNNPDLAGKPAVFKFTIHGIYETIEDLDKLREMAEDEDSPVNTNVNDTFGAYGITDLDSLIEYERSYIDNTLSSNKYSDAVSAIKDYMLENCTVEVPEDYLDARVTEYQVSFENDNLEDSQTLEDFLNEQYNGTTVEEARESWSTSQEKQIKTEFIFGLIAEKEGIELDEDEFSAFVTSIVSNASSTGLSFSNENDVYKYYGGGEAENGKKYMRQLFLMNKAIDFVYENADITVEAPSEDDTESVEGTEEE